MHNILQSTLTSRLSRRMRPNLTALWKHKAWFAPMHSLKWVALMLWSTPHVLVLLASSWQVVLLLYWDGLCPYLPFLLLRHHRIGEKFLVWTDVDPSLETILESVSLYWLTETFPRSIYPYRQVCYFISFDAYSIAHSHAALSVTHRRCC